MDATLVDRTNLIEKINTLYDTGDFAGALDYLEQLAGIDGETANILDFRFDLLTKQNNYTAAHTTALKLEEMSLRKSPWNCLKIAEACLGMGQVDKALDWLEIAIRERHFKRADVFGNPVYNALSSQPRFLSLLEQIRENTGLNKPAPDFTVTLLDGSEFTLSTMQGQVVLLDFWDSDCPPCIREMPSMKNLYADFKDQGFEIIGISLDAHRSDTEKFIAKNSLSWKIGCSGKGFMDETADLFKIEATPSTWLVDKKGILRFYNLKGPVLRDAVQQLLAEKNPELKCRGDYCTL